MRSAFRSPAFRLGHLVDPVAVERLMDAKGTFAYASTSEAFRVFMLECWAEEFGVEC